MERELGKDLEQGKKRVAFLMDNPATRWKKRGI